VAADMPASAEVAVATSPVVAADTGAEVTGKPAFLT
jgi:hypothetical protein